MRGYVPPLHDTRKFILKSKGHPVKYELGMIVKCPFCSVEFGPYDNLADAQDARSKVLKGNDDESVQCVVCSNDNG
jgi:hypothetical protein